MLFLSISLTRTKIHARTDYLSVQLVKDMVQHGKEACFLLDKNGWLPAHIACSRHCSVEKLDILLEVNPSAIDAITYNDDNRGGGDTLLSLAKSTATKGHPNHTLIQHILAKTADVPLRLMVQQQQQQQQQQQLKHRNMADLALLRFNQEQETQYLQKQQQ